MRKGLEIVLGGLISFTTLPLGLPLAGRAPTVRAQETPKQPCFDCKTLDASKAPRYRIARQWRIVTGGLTLHISIAQKHFNRRDLVALGCRLSRDFRQENDLFAFVFDNHRSAKRYVDPWGQELPADRLEHEKALRSYYLRDVAKSEHWVAWYEDPLHKKAEISEDLCLERKNSSLWRPLSPDFSRGVSCGQLAGGIRRVVLPARQGVSVVASGN